jgi:hypothetical protein
VFRYFPSKRNFECGNPLTCTVLYLPDIQFESVVISTQQALLDIRVKNATYVCEKLPGRQMLYVWATMTRFAVTEPVEIRVTTSN